MFLVHIFLSTYFVTSVSEISEDLHKKASMDEQNQNLLVNVFA